ncbi:MAG: hypothetical protein WA160_16130 [Pseudobdellovibrio sp.]
MEIEQTNDSTSKNQQLVKKVISAKKINVLKKLDPDTVKLLQLFKDKVNKKAFGRKVKDSEIIAAGIKLLGPDQLKDLQQQTYSEKDRLSMAHEEFQKQNGKISLDQFIGKLLKGEVTSKN